MTATRRRLLAAVAAATAAFSLSPALAQKLPAGKPVSIVLPVAPGGMVDLLARRIAPHLSTALGQPVVVENKAGGSGAIAGAHVAQATPDGTTVLIGALDLATLPAMLAQKNFVPLQHLAPVGAITSGPLVLVVNAEKVPARTLPEFVAWAKANPGTVTFGSAGNGNITHLFGEMFRRAAGVEIRHVPYRGTGPALTDLQAGQIAMLMAGPAGVKPHVEAGKLRALALTGKVAGMGGLTGVRTFSELGLPMPETDMGAWQGLFVAKGTPREAILQLNLALNTALAHPEMREFMARVGVNPEPGTPEALGTLLESQTKAWGEVIKQAGITPG